MPPLTRRYTRPMTTPETTEGTIQTITPPQVGDVVLYWTGDGATTATAALIHSLSASGGYNLVRFVMGSDRVVWAFDVKEVPLGQPTVGCFSQSA